MAGVQEERTTDTPKNSEEALPAEPRPRLAACLYSRVMIRAGTGVSSAASTPVAAGEAASAALEALGGVLPAAALIVATPHHAQGLGEALREVQGRIGDAALAGATVDGVLVPGPGAAAPQHRARDAELHPEPAAAAA